jgi:hypothetical protein
MVVIQYLDHLLQPAVAAAQHGMVQAAQQVLAGPAVVVFSLMQHPETEIPQQ